MLCTSAPCPPSEINLGFRVQGVGFSRGRINLERAWGLGLGVSKEQDLDQPLEVDPARSAAVIEHLSAKRLLCARVVIGEQAIGLFSNAPLDALTSATSPASCRIPLAVGRRGQNAQLEHGMAPLVLKPPPRLGLIRGEV